MKTIVWDIDDVLNELMKEWFEKKWCAAHPECRLSYTEISQNPPHELLSVSLEEYRLSLDEFRLEYGHQLKPVPEMLSWFQQHGNKFQHVALTAVPVSLSHVSAAWLFRYFGSWIRSFNIVPSPRTSDLPSSYHQTKKDFLQWIGKGDIMIDDNTANIEGARALGLRAFIMPQPWNHHDLSRQEILRNLAN
jgi:FMN phosphatase YigB (HAD superfamily)